MIRTATGRPRRFMSGPFKPAIGGRLRDEATHHVVAMVGPEGLATLLDTTINLNRLFVPE